MAYHCRGIRNETRILKLEYQDYHAVLAPDLTAQLVEVYPARSGEFRACPFQGVDHLGWSTDKKFRDDGGEQLSSGGLGIRGAIGLWVVRDGSDASGE